MNDCAHSCLEYNEEILDNEVDISNLMYELAEENLLFKMGTSAKKVYEEIIEKIFNNKEFENKILVNRIPREVLITFINSKRIIAGGGDIFKTIETDEWSLMSHSDRRPFLRNNITYRINRVFFNIYFKRLKIVMFCTVC